jgi:DNA repair exonuclease SbcCD ATPase subunit
MPAEPEEYTGRVVDFKIYQRMYEEDKERMQLLAYARPHMDTIIACALITKEQIEEVSNADLMQARINRIQNTVSEIRAKISLQSVLRNKAKLTRIRLAELKVELNDEEPLKVILNAYSDKGMKRNAIQSISNTLMKTINLYAKSVFAEDYEFEFRWDTSQLSLLVHRKFGDKVLTSDVRKLSSAETKLFTIILVLALLTFVPSNKRSNILILDEPDANFSEETTEAFKKLLPVLLSVIPSIIVITPKTNERYENAHNFTVVKDKGVSTIQKGHPASLK